MDTTDTAVARGSGNVFADLGLPDADAHLVKAELVNRIDDIVRKRGITRTEAARLLGLSPPDVSRLLRGDFREYSLERPVPAADRARGRYRQPGSHGCESRNAGGRLRRIHRRCRRRLRRRSEQRKE